jgi:hypothetical protein
VAGSKEGRTRRRGRLFCWFERAILGAGMGIVAFIVERRLLRALKRGAAPVAPRTAERAPQAAPVGASERGELTTAAQ